MMKMDRYLIFAVLFLSLFTAGFAQEKADSKERQAIFEEGARLFSEREKEVLNYLQEFAPQKAEMLKMLAATNPKEYQGQIMLVMEEMMKARKIEQADPERYEQLVRMKALEEKTHVLGRAYRDASEAQKAKIERELQTLLVELFDLREEKRREEVARLEQRLAELKKSLEMRKQNKAEIIKRRMAQLTGKTQHLEWE